MIYLESLTMPSWNCTHFIPSYSYSKIEEEFRQYSIALFECSVQKVTDDKSLLHTIADALQFPEYFGRNWDALDECLLDLPLSKKGCFLVCHQSKALWKNAPLSGGKLIMSWQSAARQWAKEGVPLHLLFVL